MPDADDRGSAWRVPPSAYLARRPPAFGIPAPPRSLYLTMADGCRLAADVYLPTTTEAAHAAPRWPTVCIFTPYYRRFKLKAGAAGTEPSPNIFKYRDMFVPRGYALVVVDVRGTGASFGTRDSFRSPREREDFRQIADWIVAQPWSDGAHRRDRHLLSRAPRATSSPAPGIRPSRRSRRCSRCGTPTRPLLSGRHAAQPTGRDLRRADGRPRPRPTRSPAHVRLLRRSQSRWSPSGGRGRGRRACAAPRSPSTSAISTCRISSPSSASRMSGCPTTPASRRRRSVPIITPPASRPMLRSIRYRAGWTAPDTPMARFPGYLTLPNAHRYLLLGPWDHGARVNVSPWRNRVDPEFVVLAEVLRFFDEHLAGLDTGLRARAAGSLLHDGRRERGVRAMHGRRLPTRRRISICRRIAH